MTRKRVALVLLGLVAVAMALGTYSRFSGRTRLRFPYLGTPMSEVSYQSLASQPGWKKAAITVAQGVSLRGLIRVPQSAVAPWLLFYPGNDEAQLKRGQAFLTRLAGARDFGLATFAYRGFDSSEGTSELAALAQDAPRILESLLKSERIAPSQLNVLGFSIGGHFAVHAVGATARRGTKVASLTLLASVDDIVMVRPSLWQRLDSGDDYQTRPLLIDIQKPVLVLQGSADEALNGPAQGRAIAAKLGKRARYVELQGVGHTALLKSEAALAEIREFIAKPGH
ncbi:MAG: hypothetical protein SFV15_10855 [Polyangiaceae bacterium]|nr:hypothetical protein [Polyangiaceae bacterium]